MKLKFWQKDDKTIKPDFKVIIHEDVGFSVRVIKTFFAFRYVDKDKIPFIYNEDLNFMELYPQDLKDNAFLDAKEIETKLKFTLKQLKDIRNKKIEDYKEEEPNTNDLEFLIMQLQAKQRALQYSKSAAYVSFDEQGFVTFHFLRKGNSFFAMKWDTDTLTIHTACEPVVKKAGILLRNKEKKYDINDAVNTSAIILLVIGLVLIGINLFGGAYLYKKYDGSNLAELELKNLELQTACSDGLVKNVESFNKLLDKTEEYIEQRPTTQVVGLVPE